MTQQPHRNDRPSNMTVAKLVGIGMAIAALITFFLQNLHSVEINFLWISWSTRMLWALLASAAVGAIAAGLISTIRRHDVVVSPRGKR